jgi:hypothetical protein
MTINVEWQTVTKYKRGNQTLGWIFEAECGYTRKLLDEYFTDSHGAALATLQNHKCSATTMPKTPEIK